MSAGQLVIGLPLAAACLLWLALPWLAWRTVRRVPRLAREPLVPPERWPSVSILVPARDEADTLPAAQRTRRALDYPQLEVVLVDDRSTDGTQELVDRMAEEDERTTAVHVETLPPGWLGKPHALARAAEVARGEWLLFTDADVHFAPDAVRRAVAWAEDRGYDSLVAMPDLGEADPVLECVMAAFGTGFTISSRLWAVEDPDSSASIGVGAFNLVRREALERIGGVEALRMDVADDLVLGQLLKATGARCGVVSGQDLVRVAWYPDLRSMVLGLEKNTFALAGFRLHRVLVMVVFALLAYVGPVAALLPLGVAGLRALAVAASGAILVTGLGMARWARRPLWPSLLWPLGGLVMVWIVVRTALVCSRRGTVAWRGTEHSLDELRAQMKLRLPGVRRPDAPRP